MTDLKYTAKLYDHPKTYSKQKFSSSIQKITDMHSFSFIKGAVPQQYARLAFGKQFVIRPHDSQLR